MIRGEQLMVGDYVDTFGNGNPIDFGIVHEIRYCGKEIAINFDDISGIFAENEISPIKLTKDFFLKNGFKELCRTDYSTRLYNSDLYLRVKITPENRFTCNYIDVNYIHEFQHYLRLVNLSDYANSLKI